MSNILIAYFSRKGENYCNGSIKELKKGNTEIVAEFICDAVNGELFEIISEKPYASGYTKCTEQADEELKNNMRPNLKNYLNSIEKYDTIFIGFPNWWGTMPMPVWTFLEYYDLRGKTIIPFCTNEGSGMGRSEEDLRKICKGSKIKSGISIYGMEAKECRERVSEWAKKSVNIL